jgi:hypothetical protein
VKRYHRKLYRSAIRRVHVPGNGSHLLRQNR